MIYQERDLAVVVIAALGAGYLVGAEMRPSPPPVVAAGAGMTIVHRLELPPQPRPAIEHFEGEVLRVTLTTAPLMLQPSPWQDAPPAPQPEPEVTPQERAMLQQQQPEKPRDACYPGHRQFFAYKGVQHWRCRYDR